jgi:hypothetical protein
MMLTHVQCSAGCVRTAEVQHGARHGATICSLRRSPRRHGRTLMSMTCRAGELKQSRRLVFCLPKDSCGVGWYVHAWHNMLRMAH